MGFYCYDERAEKWGDKGKRFLSNEDFQQFKKENPLPLDGEGFIECFLSSSFLLIVGKSGLPHFLMRRFCCAAGWCGINCFLPELVCFFPVIDQVSVGISHFEIDR